MVRTQIYLPLTLKRQLMREARLADISFSELIRESLEKQLKQAQKKQPINGATLLLEMAAQAKKKNLRGPRDLSINHDKYLYGGKV